MTASEVAFGLALGDNLTDRRNHSTDTDKALELDKD